MAPTVSVTLSPALESPPTVPVTAMLWPASAELIVLSAVMLATVMVALAVVSTVYGRLALAVIALPAASIAATLAVTLVDAARALPGTPML